MQEKPLNLAGLFLAKEYFVKKQRFVKEYDDPKHNEQEDNLNHIYVYVLEYLNYIYNSFFNLRSDMLLFY